MGLIATYSVPAAAAHDGHGETVVITGTIHAIDSNRILIEALDDESFRLKHVWIVTTESTRYKRGTSRVRAAATELMTGDRIVAVASDDRMEDYSQRLLALQIELTSTRHPRIQVKRPGGQVLSILIR